MSIECKSAHHHRNISIILFAAGAIMLAFNTLILLLSAYTADPLVDDIASWLYVTGMFIILFAIAVTLMIIAAIINIVSNKTLVKCVLN
jgi:hypothetical protein